MRLLSAYSEVLAAGWEHLLAVSPCATWFQSPEAYRFFASLQGEMNPFVFGVEDDDVLVGVIAGYVTCERSAAKQFFTRRAIIYGGALLDDHISDEALSLLLAATRKQLSRKAIYIELRNLHDYSRWKSVFAAQGFDYVPHLNFQVACTDLQSVMARFKNNRKRQVRKALQNGAVISEAQSEYEVTAYYQLLKDLYKRKVKTPLPSVNFFLNFYRERVGKILLIKYQDTIIGGIVCPVLENRTLYEWYICGLDKQYRQQYPSVLATYAAIDYATTYGIASFDFMGAGSPHTAYGVRTFKSRFGGKEVEYGRFLHIVHPILYRLGKFLLGFSQSSVSYLKRAQN